MKCVSQKKMKVTSTYQADENSALHAYNYCLCISNVLTWLSFCSPSRSKYHRRIFSLCLDCSFICFHQISAFIIMFSVSPCVCLAFSFSSPRVVRCECLPFDLLHRFRSISYSFRNSSAFFLHSRLMVI